MKHLKLTAFALAGSALLAACADDPTQPAAEAATRDADVSAFRGNAAASAASMVAPDAEVAARLVRMNDVLAAEGAPVRFAFAELLLASDAPAHVGTTVYAEDRMKQLPTRWVPGDSRRAADGDNLTYLVDESHSFAFTRMAPGVGEGVTNFATSLADSFSPWDELACSSLTLVRRADTGVDPSIYDDGNGQWWLADMVEAGFMELPAGVLGVTFTAWFVDEAGNPTDVDGDGRADTALKEIWYNSGYWWASEPTQYAVHLPSVAIHENGHALEIGHFGRIFATDRNGKLHVAPRAIMNAAYLEPDPTLYGTDEASYCSNFENWPN